MEVRQAISPNESKALDTENLRNHFLIESLFSAGLVKMVYSHQDRTVVAGFMPVESPIELATNKQIGSEYFLARREASVINIGEGGRIVVDGVENHLNERDGLYIPKGSKSVRFESDLAENPAQYYFVSSPAHAEHALRKIAESEARLIELGSGDGANIRKLRQYIHPDVCTSCQLTMGVTSLEIGSIWNTMPCHTHDRRSEVYFYFDMAEETRVVHLMGEPNETRHLIVGSQQAVLSPGWSIHSGAGTARYRFIWSMAGDNQNFDDMDFVDMEDLM